MRIGVGLGGKDAAADLLAVLEQAQPPAATQCGRARVDS
ncbi:hypothetical protein N234_37565 [Ralstonia pickettii DTP0602]|nr:hypothetical protein N234_37565 [Ralstonia pickettii DTP0602]